MGQCASAATGRYPVSVHVYTIIDGDEDPLFGLMAGAYGVQGIYMTTVKYGGMEYVFDSGHRPPPAPASAGAAGAPAPPSRTAAPPASGTATQPPASAPAAATPQRKGGIRSYKARRVHASSKPPADVHGADSVRGMKGEIPMGTTTVTRKQLAAIIAEFGAMFNESTYDLRTRNPNHFADALCQKLVGKGLPEWVNRAAVRAARDHSSTGRYVHFEPAVVMNGLGTPGQTKPPCHSLY